MTRKGAARLIVAAMAFWGAAGCLADFTYSSDTGESSDDVKATESETDIGSTDSSEPGSDTDTGAVSCAGVVCDSPPPSSCIDADHIRQYDSSGTCTDGECVYPSDSLLCEHGCEAGVCNEKECDEGPCCSSGELRGPEVRCNEEPYVREFGCATDTCGGDARQRLIYQHCSGLSSECGVENLVPSMWTTVEACDPNSLCHWDMGDAWCEVCPFGCKVKVAECAANPCEGVTCLTPENDYCFNVNQLRDYGSFGVCTGGVCNYSYKDIFCTTGCDTLTGDDRCRGNPCQDVECLLVPGDQCVDENNARIYAGTGECSNGECEYPYTEIFCTYGCNELTGRCRQPECDGGPCCESGFFRPSTYVCETTTAHRCGGDSCGDDPESRLVERRCSGTSATCSGATSPGTWSPSSSCSVTQMCQSDGGGAWCQSCKFGCGGSGCYSECAPADPCCDAAGLLRDTSFVCASRKEYRCDSGECGALSQKRTVDTLCDGSNATCSGRDLTGSWTTINDCSFQEVCEATSGGAGCVPCAYGCSAGACNSTQCSSGPCCKDGLYKTAGIVCDSQVEYSCTSASCGADGVERTVTRACTGNSATCDGSPSYSAPSTIASCGSSDVCAADGLDATCTGCPLGCEAGACDTVCSKGANVALTATASNSAGGTGTWGPLNLNDGRKATDSCNFAWVTAANVNSNAWFRLVWSTPQTLYGLWVDINKLNDTTCWDGGTLEGATIQWWDGAIWVTDGTVSGKTDDFSYQFTAPITTTQVRLYRVYASVASTGQKSNPQVYELEAYKCN
ncbi:MAG: hypothetical protein MUC50_15785 [Myxococcota bacterium]|nr:hypothetical protein [Myxococcota bacterium]